MIFPPLQSPPRDEGPVYQHLAEQIRSRIRAGELGDGERLPPIRSLAQRLKLNRDTVALAYETLAGEGLVDAVVGRGTFVRKQRPGPAVSSPAQLSMAAPVERLLRLEGGRPRFSNGEGVVGLHTLVPDPSFYPVDAFRRALNRALEKAGPDLFLYGSPQGHPGLRAALAERFRRAGLDLADDQIVLCHGASQGISLAIRLFAEAGESVAVEMPTYHHVMGVLTGLGLHPAPVSMTEHGPDLDQLERVLARPEVKAFYTIPSFHNPMGTTTSLARRREVLALAEHYQKPVLEDAFEMDLRYAGRPIPSLAALDRAGLVVHLFSFSKALFPGVRVGSIAARGRVVEGLLALKRAADLSDSPPMQAALAEFVQNGSYDRHLSRMRQVLRSRRDTLLDALSQAMPPGTTWTRPEGGYQIWLELPFEVDTRDLLADAGRAGVQFAPGSQFFHDGRSSRGMRLTVAQADEEEIRRGVAALGRLVRERLEADPGARLAASVHV